MAHETVSVRMNRSDPNIRWGVTFRKQGNDLVINNVERESLSEKAGIKNGDIVQTILGRSAQGMDGFDANRICDSSQYEVTLTLQRYVTSHSCLPWTLTEKDNKIVVDEVRSFGGGISGAIGSGFGTNIGSNLGANSPNFNRGLGTHATSNATNNYFNNNYYNSNSSNAANANTKQNFNQTTATNFSSTYGNSANSPNFHQQQNLNRYPAPMPLKENRITFNQYVSNQYNANSDNAKQSWSRSDYSKSNGHSHPVTIPTTFLGNRQETFAPSASRLPFARKSNQNYFDNSYIGNVNSSQNQSWHQNSNQNNNWQQQNSTYNTSSYVQGSMPGYDSGRPLQRSATDQDINRYSNNASNQAYNNCNYRSSSNAPPQTYSYNNGLTSSSYGRGSGGVPLNEQAYIQTSGPMAERIGRAQSRNRTVSPASRVFYHSPSPRSRNELSPSASVHHLQYNSPMNLYSIDAAAEEYYQQTGRMPR
ncbi:hypothetical protein WR25_18770 isoform A [Diploscapter pachys]|uniref:PDZ domain-containing protein n=1 Tax=Diploscapter pachys TaxID=2018661 RepID=A0A2A2JQH4_9BILA|nr:hypothetical protein WR25_18770 isoform A [Diploscapter pachys]